MFCVVWTWVIVLICLLRHKEHKMSQLHWQLSPKHGSTKVYAKLSFGIKYGKMLGENSKSHYIFYVHLQNQRKGM